MSGINPFVTHVSGGQKFNYPAAGGPKPPGGAKVHILTAGGICIDGQWSDDRKRKYLGWAPLPMRDREQEAAVMAAWAAEQAAEDAKSTT